MANIKPGGMGSPVLETTPPEFSASMAAAIEAAYRDLLAADGKDSFSTTTNTEEDRDRRRLFTAIAIGVVRHLEDNDDALRVVAATGGGSRVEIDVTWT